MADDRLLKQAADVRAETRRELLMVAGLPRLLQRPARWSLKLALRVIAWVERQAKELR